VDTVQGFEAKASSVVAYVIISRPTGAMLAIRPRPERFEVVERRDRVRDIEQRWYTCPSRELRGMDVLVQHLKGKRP
jgi:hypothetical protein